jgi:conjugal transfer pilus assembly protein TraV
MTKLTSNLLLLLSIGLLTGCASGPTSFDCPGTQPAQCASLEKIDRQVDEGRLPGTRHPGRPRRVSGSMDGQASHDQWPSAPDPGEPKRTGDQVMRVWVAPYVDGEDTWHQPAVLYPVLQRGHWRSQPNQSHQPEQQGGQA